MIVPYRAPYRVAIVSSVACPEDSQKNAFTLADMLRSPVSLVKMSKSNSVIWAAVGGVAVGAIGIDIS